MELDNFNSFIPIYHLYIHPSDLSEMRRDIWCDDPLPAKLTFDKKKLEIDLAYRGSHIRKSKKKSYHVSFKKPAKYRNAKELHLNSEYRDPSLIRNKLSLDFFSEIGTLSPKSRHVFLKINGKNEGVYLELESVDEHYLASRKLPSGSIFYAIDGDANFSLMSDLDKEVKKSLDSGYEMKFGTERDNFYLQEMILNINTIMRAEFETEIQKYINVDQYLRWLAGVVFTQNYDGFVHNYALYRNGVTGQFEMIPWDYDATWGRDVNGKYMNEDYVRIQGFNTLTARILDVDSYRKNYKTLLLEIMNNQFSTEYMIPKVDRLASIIRPYVLKDPYLKERIDQFDNEPEYIARYIKARSTYIKSQLSIFD